MDLALERYESDADEGSPGAELHAGVQLGLA